MPCSAVVPVGDHAIMRHERIITEYWSPKCLSNLIRRREEKVNIHDNSSKSRGRSGEFGCRENLKESVASQRYASRVAE